MKYLLSLLTFLLLCASCTQQDETLRQSEIVIPARGTGLPIDTVVPLPTTALLTPETPKPTIIPITSTPRPTATISAWCIPGDAKMLLPTGENYFENGRLTHIGKGMMTDIDWSGDGKRIAVSTNSGIHILDAETLEEQYFLDIGYESNIIKFSPDSQWIASDYCSGIAVWDVETGKLISSFGRNFQVYRDRYKPDFLANDILFTPDGTKILAIALHGFSYGVPYLLEVWDIKTETLNHALSAQEQEPYHIKNTFIDPSGKLVAIAYHDSLYFWHIESGDLVKSFEFEEYEEMLGFAADESTVFMKNEAGQLSTLDIHTGERVQLSNIGTETHLSQMMPDHTKLITHDFENDWAELDIRDAHSGEKQFTVSDPDYVFDFAVHPNGTKLATIDYYQNVKIQDLTNDQVASNQSYDFWGGSIHFLPDDSGLLIADKNNIYVYDIESGEITQTFFVEDEKNPLHGAISFSPYENIFALMERDHIQVWDIVSGEMVQEIKVGENEVMDSGGSITYQLYELPEHNRHNVDEAVYFWGWTDPVTDDISWIPKTCETYRGSISSSCPAAISPDGNHVVFGKNVMDGDQQNPYAIFIQDTLTSEIITRLKDVTGDYGFSFTPTGNFVVTQDGLDMYIPVSDIKTGELVINANPAETYGTGPHLSLPRFTFSHDGTRMITRNVFENVFIYDTTTWELIDRTVPASGAGAVALNSDGTMAAALTGMVVHLWEVGEPSE